MKVWPDFNASVDHQAYAGNIGALQIVARVI